VCSVAWPFDKDDARIKMMKRKVVRCFLRYIVTDLIKLFFNTETKARLHAT